MKRNRKLKQIIIVCVSMLIWSFSINAQEIRKLTAVQWSPNNEAIAEAYSDGSVIVRTNVSNEVIWEIDAHLDGQTNISWASDGVRFVTASAKDDRIKIWNLTTRQLVQELQGSQITTYDLLPMLAWNPRVDVLLYTVPLFDGGFPLYLFVNENGVMTHIEREYPSATFDMEWSPNGNTLAHVTLYGLDVFNFTSFERFPNGRNLLVAIDDVTWNQDGTQFAASSNDGFVRVIDLQSEQVISEYFNQTHEEAPIIDLLWSKDDSLIYADTFDGEIHVLDAASGQEVERLTIPREGGEFLITQSPFGGRLLLADGNSTVTTMVVLDPSLERFQTIAESCGAASILEQPIGGVITDAALSTVIAQLESATAAQIPPACAADLIAIAEAIQSQ